jgi:hypothetical protein
MKCCRMTKVTIAKSGIRTVQWDSDAGQYNIVEASSALPHLRNQCSIEAGVTLADIFDAVDRDGPLKEFLRQYSWCDVDAFHAEARAPVTQPLNLPHLEYLEISKCFEFDDAHAQETLDVGGIGEPYAAGQRRYGIDLTPVNEIAPLPVRLNPVVEVQRDGITIARAPAIFTLLDVLGEIYFEISFYGGPVQRDAFTNDLRFR